MYRFLRCTPIVSAVPSAAERYPVTSSAAWAIANKLLLLALAASTLTVAHAAAPPAVAFSDSFEGLSIYPYWSVIDDFGSIGLSKDVSYSGAHALKFSSASGGNRQISLVHNFGLLTKGTVSIAFYDVAPGQETLYEQLSVYNSKTGENAAVGTMDFDSECYSAAFVLNNVSFGPNANCGIYPQATTSPIKRTPGWHVFSVSYGQSAISLSIDGRVVYTTSSGNYQFDTIRFEVSGPYWRPNTVAYIDDFKFTPLTY